MKVLLCPLSDPGYLYPALAIGRELAAGGDTVEVLGGPAASPAAAAAGLPLLDPAPLAGFRAARWWPDVRHQYRHVLAAARRSRPDVLVTSVLAPGALLAAQAVDLPVAVIGLAAHLWSYGPFDRSPRSWLAREQIAEVAALRAELGLPARPRYPLGGDALLLRGCPELEPPGTTLPPWAHHVGPCWWEPEPDPAELSAVLRTLDANGKPVVYVHVARSFGGASPWPRLAATFTGGGFQAVVELGRSTPADPPPGSDITVVRLPWMGPLLDRAGLVLTHGTSAPVLGALLRGRPLGVTPSGSEQPILATACVRAGVAVRLPPDPGPHHDRLLRAAWASERLRSGAAQLGRRLAAAGGPAHAAAIVRALAQTPATHARISAGTS